MTPPKKISKPDPSNTLIWDATINGVTNKSFEYISVDHLKEWIGARQTKLIDGTVIVSPRICDDLLTFIDEP